MKKLLDLLKKIEKNGYEAYIVGGFVRDLLLGKSSLDVDICTSAKPDILKKIIPKLKDKDLFCSSMEMDNYNIEITTYRLESNYDGRRPLDISYAASLKEDLQRRDFKINTICIDSNGKIIDLLGGIDDLKKNVISMVGSANKKLKEDYLRILRAIRLSSVLNMQIDSELEEAIIKNKNNLIYLSAYRVRDELDKIVKKGNLEIIRTWKLEDILGIYLPNKINFCTQLIGIYAQCDIKKDNFFNKAERKHYQLLHTYYLKKIDNYDLFKLGLDNIKILEEMHNMNYQNAYHNLKIKNVKDLDMDLDKMTTESKEYIIKAILDGKLPNHKEDIMKYLDKNFN